MLNLLTNTKPWMVASLLFATSLFGQSVAACPKPCPPKPCPKPCPQPCPPTQMCAQDPCCPAWPTPVLNAAYNYPARIQTRCPWDFFGMASFIYWQPVQENLELCFTNDITVNTNIITNESFVNQDFDYKPGFKVGIGMNFYQDNWDTSLVYTWFHGNHSQSVSVDPTVQEIFPIIGNPIVFSLTPYDSGSQCWRLNMDFLDLDLGRSYYVGTKLLFRSAFGTRVNWIRQRLNATFTASTSLDQPGTYTASSKTNCWGVGPRATLDTTWIIGEGFRVFGNTGADLLYTRYTKLRGQGSFTGDSGETLSQFSSTQKKLGYLRPHFDLELGVGWGTYLDCNNWYMDFAAGYGFQAFWNQSMFRKYSIASASYAPSGDLFVHGLELTFRLDF